MSEGAEQVDSFARAIEIEIAPRRETGELRRWTPVWVVGVDGQLFVRTWHRRDTGWYGAAVRSGSARVRTGGVESDVRVDDIGDQPSDLRATIDDAFRGKYGAGASTDMVTDDAAVSTLRLVLAGSATTEELYLAGGCLWGVQAFVQNLPGVTFTEAGRVNGSGRSLDGDYDGYAECVRTRFDPNIVTVRRLLSHLFEIIDPYSVNQQGPDVGEKYRTGVYSESAAHVEQARAFIAERDDADRIAVEVAPLANYIRSADEHQDRLARHPEDSCHLPSALIGKYSSSS